MLVGVEDIRVASSHLQDPSRQAHIAVVVDIPTALVERHRG
jgi:hypothetical protein